MLFTQGEFYIFFGVVLILQLVLRSDRVKKLVLLAASYYFYAYWDIRFLSLIVLSTVVDYLVGRCLANEERAAMRKTLLIVSLIVNLGVLGFFKYFNFFVDSLKVVLAPFGFELQTLNIILPVGISFYTFQTMSYTIDVYRRRLTPCLDFWDFSLFVAFFPQLVAGPIVRASDFLPQLTTPRQLTWERGFLGSRQFIFGLFKKVFIADRLAFFVDEVFSNSGLYSSSTTWLAVIAYAVQIYCDFSGYSDMAIGAARCLGYDFAENFAHPYVATSLREFWQRWHISLSTWLRDYLYIPLGGNRHGTWNTYRNLLITMLLGGLWHGAAWTFVIWGAIHGAMLGAWRFVSSIWTDAERPVGGGPWRAFLGWLLTMQIVLVAWVFFRAQDFASALRTLQQMYLPVPGIVWLPPSVPLAILLIAFTHALSVTPWSRLRELPSDRLYTPVILCLLVWIVIVFRPTGFQPFIYFQF